MTKGLNGFLKGLKFEGAEESQKQVIEEMITKQLFIIMPELNMKNGETIKLSDVVNMISSKLENQANKKQIAQVITQVLQRGEYNYKIDDNGDIKACYSTADILQKSYEEKVHEEAETILHTFVEKVEQHARQLEKQNIKVTEFTLMNLFNEVELQKNSVWIDLAIAQVLKINER